MQQTRATQWKKIVPLFLWLAVVGLVFVNQQRIKDWVRLWGYTPPREVAATADRSSMTPLARHLWYVNKPQIIAGKDFSTHCPLATEKTVILGCYRGADGGIYVYRVTDTRLAGVIEVTAAHEMLHAAYDRLSGDEKKRIDSLLDRYYAQGLTDERVKATIDAYRTTEPHALTNEMHSIFATEVMQLPAELEAYYRRYFTDRKAVVAMTERYQGEFTSRKKQVSAYDAELKSLKAAIDGQEQSLANRRRQINADQANLARMRQSDPAAYNQAVDSYNSQVETYNALLRDIKAQIDAYNAIVEKRNAIALEEQQLTQALTGQSLPAVP